MSSDPGGVVHFIDEACSRLELRCESQPDTHAQAQSGKHPALSARCWEVSLIDISLFDRSH